MRNILFILLSFSFFTAASQQYNPDKIKPKAVALYQKALQQLSDGYLKETIPVLQKCISIDTNYVDAYLSLAGIYGEMKHYAKAVEFYEHARNKDTTYFKVFALPYSINLAGLGRFEDALNAVNTFLTVPRISEGGARSGNYRKRCYEFAVNYKKTHANNTYLFRPFNLGDSVNSSESEYYPSVTIDDSLLIFTKRVGDGEMFMESKLINDSTYGKAKEIDGSLNEYSRKGAITVSSDGEWLIFAGDLPNKGGYGDYDLYISYWTADGWSEPENMGPNINTPYWESSPSLSPDRRFLYFSSNRPDGYGGMDLYVSTRQPNGKWGPAVNMGPDINTVGNELAPFIHVDNQTLYFTSDGLPGYGGSDLFVIRKKPDGTWSIPENLGYPINTIENEGSLAVSADGLTAYYASDRSDTRGELDLYKFNLREDIRPFRTLYVKGKVTDAKTGKGLPCAVELIDNNNRSALMRLQTDELGKFFVPLPTGKDYTFTVNRKGYLFYSEQFALTNKQADSTYEKNIALQPVELNASMVMENIQFETNSYQLLPVSIIELDKLVQVLTENSSLKIEISGHTDNIGKDEDNLTLSTNRAKSVVEYLVGRGIDVKRLTYKGYGASKPIADNATEEGRAKNRRTEFIITGM